jgi:hypothetical protein
MVSVPSVDDEKIVIIESRRDVRIQAGVLTPDKEYPIHNKPRKGWQSNLQGQKINV